MHEKPLHLGRAYLGENSPGRRREQDRTQRPSVLMTRQSEGMSFQQKHSNTGLAGAPRVIQSNSDAVTGTTEQHAIERPQIVCSQCHPRTCNKVVEMLGGASTGHLVSPLSTKEGSHTLRAHLADVCQTFLRLP